MEWEARGRCAERWHHHACQGPLWQQLLLSTCLHVCITASQQNHPTMVSIILFSSTSLQPANHTGLSSSVRRMARDQWTSDGTPLQRLLCQEHAAQEYDAPEPGASALSLGDCVTASAGTTTTGLSRVQMEVQGGSTLIAHARAGKPSPRSHPGSGIEHPASLIHGPSASVSGGPRQRDGMSPCTTTSECRPPVDWVDALYESPAAPEHSASRARCAIWITIDHGTRVTPHGS